MNLDPFNLRVGYGYDSHQLGEGRKLILGGVEVPFEKGLIGHSDADVLLHAIIDSVLGATGQGDIGTWFPDSDEKYKDISSKTLVLEVWSKCRADGWKICNLDSTISAERPKLAPVIPEIKKTISELFQCEESRVNVKATTGEGMGFVGRGEGISASATVLLVRD